MTEHDNLVLLDRNMVLFEEEPADEGCGNNCTAVFWVKSSFVVFCFVQGMVAGMIPIWCTTCRTNPKILGVA